MNVSLSLLYVWNGNLRRRDSPRKS